MIARPALLAALAIGVVIVLLVVGRNIARAQETFTISGQAVNGTGGATLPPGPFQPRPRSAGPSM